MSHSEAACTGHGQHNPSDDSHGLNVRCFLCRRASNEAACRCSHLSFHERSHRFVLVYAPMRMMGATTHGITISVTSPGVAEAQKNSIISQPPARQRGRKSSRPPSWLAHSSVGYLFLMDRLHPLPHQ